MTLLKFVISLLISAIAYLVIGVILFFYMLIDQLKALKASTDSRPINYFKYNVDTIIIILNVLTGMFRIVGSIMIIYFITLLKTEKNRTKAEKEEMLIKMNESNRDTNYTLSEINNGIVNVRRIMEEEKDPVNEEDLNLRVNIQRKTSYNSEFGDNYKRFETPKTISRLSQLNDKV